MSAVRVRAAVDMLSEQEARRVERMQAREALAVGAVHFHFAFPVALADAKSAQSCMMTTRFSSMSPRR